MKSRAFVVAAFLVIFSAGSAFADDMDFGSLEPEQVKKGAPTLEEGKASTSVSDGLTTEGGPTGTSGYSAGKSSWSEFKRNLGFGFFNYSNMNASEVNRNKGYLESYNYLTMEYRVAKGAKVFFRPAFLFNSAGQDLRGTNVDSKFAWSDAYLGFASYNIPWLPF